MYIYDQIRFFTPHCEPANFLLMTVVAANNIKRDAMRKDANFVLFERGKSKTIASSAALLRSVKLTYSPRHGPERLWLTPHNRTTPSKPAVARHSPSGLTPSEVMRSRPVFF